MSIVLILFSVATVVWFCVVTSLDPPSNRVVLVSASLVVLTLLAVIVVAWHQPEPAASQCRALTQIDRCV